jgi:putative NADPH-quinone reductase
MNALILLSHPLHTSLNHAMASAVSRRLEEAGAAVHLRDLYREGFDPVLSREELQRRFSLDEKTQEHTREARWADLLVFVHPDWWGFAPAIMKGWLDRVLRPGVAYDYIGQENSEKRHVGLFGHKRALVICTSDATAPGSNDPPYSVASTWSKVVFPFCGIERFRVRVFHEVRNAGLRTRKAWIGEAGSIAAELLSESLPQAPEDFA